MAELCRLQARGNGTTATLLRAAASALDLEVDDVVHSEDRFWHAVLVRERATLERRGVEAGEPTRSVLPLRAEAIGLEENPLHRVAIEATPRRHAECFATLRRGFEAQLLQVRIEGIGARCHGPMFVNRDEGRGIGYDGFVPEGSALVFHEDGRVLLDGGDVRASAYGWQGACFADADDPSPLDFRMAGPGVAAGPIAHFVESLPPAALDRGFSFPHAGVRLPAPGIGVGETRYAFFVRPANLGARTPASPEDGGGEHARTVTPIPFAAFADRSVFEAGEGESREPAARVGLSWLEHEAYKVVLWIPTRLRVFDGDTIRLADALRVALDRVRPAGVELEVRYLDERWILGDGVLREDDELDPLLRILPGTVLWAVPGP